MFGYTSDIARILKLGLLDADITGGFESGAFIARNAGFIDNCFVTGKVTGSENCGGFAGKSYGHISNCFSRVNIKKNPYSEVYNESFGGFAGYGSGEIINCYSTGSVEYYPFGINPVNKGFLGYKYQKTTFSNNYWNVETSGQTSSVGSSVLGGLTITQMKDQLNFNNWNFTKIWKINSKINSGYPYLVAFDGNTDELSKPEIKLLSHEETKSSISFELGISFIGGSPITAYGIILDTIPEIDFASSNYFKKIDFSALSETDTISTVFDNLEKNSTFYALAFASNSFGSVISQIVKVNTLPEDPVQPEGTGDTQNPYLISKLQELYWIADQVNNKNQDFKDKYFVQVADIDATDTKDWFDGLGWIPIGHIHERFNGSYYGSGYTISGLHIDETNDMDSYAYRTDKGTGLFGTVDTSAHLFNINLEESDYTINLSSGGLLCGKNFGLVEQCNVKGKIVSNSIIGGFIGMNNGIVISCEAQVGILSTYGIEAPDQEPLQYTSGGFIGTNNGSIERSISNSMIEANWDCAMFVGINFGKIENCYTKANNVEYGFGSGGNTTINCYSIGKSLYHGFGYGGTGCFWDIETTGYSEDEEDIREGITGLSSAEMKKAHHYINAGWDFVGETTNGTNDIWVIHPRYNNGYPFLAWEAPQLTYLGGTVYYDRDENGNNDTDDVPIRGLTVELLPEGTITGTAHDGSFVFYAEPGEHTVKIHAEHPYHKGIDALEYPITVTLLKDTILNPVGLYGESLFDFDINLATSWTRCGRSTPLWVVVENFSNVPTDAVAHITIDDRVTVLSADTIPSTHSGNNYEFTFDNIQPYETKTIRFNVRTPNAMTDSVKYSANITQNGSVIAQQTLKRLVRCSYDPNDVQVFPEGVQPDGNVPMDQELTYMIRFQNTGNDTAFMVDVYDTLSANMDPRSFKFITSSHETRYYVNPDGSMRFLFEDINLLDSTSNEPMSHGFILFSVKPKQGLVSGDVAELKAYIYFDYNPAVLTNTVISTFTDKDSPISQKLTLKSGWNLISLNVNPADKSIQSVFEGCLTQIEQVKTYDAYYVSDKPPFFNTLNTIEGGMAYLVYARSESECLVTGNLLDIPYSYSLHKGWNMVGYPSADSADISLKLNTIPVRVAKNFEGFWEPETELNSLLKFEPGKGYFIYSEGETELLWEE